MRIEKHITLYLTEFESNALKQLLGKHSEESKLKLGLSHEQAQVLSEMWDQLPNPEDND